MSIHTGHPFADPDPDPARRLRSRIGATVSLWTAWSRAVTGGAGGEAPAGLTVSSYVVALGEPARVVALLDPDADLTVALLGSGRGLLALLRWADRDLAEVFAGTAPAPGGPFARAAFESTPWGPRPAAATTWAGLALESSVEVGWSLQVTCRLEHAEVGEEPDPLVSRRGRWVRPAGP